MPSSISLAVLATCMGVMVLGNGLPSNDIQIKGRDSNKMQLILDLYCAKLQASLDMDIHTTLAEAFSIMGESYRYEFLMKTFMTKKEVKSNYYSHGPYYNTNSERYQYTQVSSPIKSLKVDIGKCYYKNDSSTHTFYSVRIDDDGKTNIIESKNEGSIPSFFDSITISYPEEKLLNFGNIEIKTEEPYFKYRVAHHLLEKLYFIGFNSTEAISGTLFSADLSGANSSSVQANQILQDMNVDEFVDVTVDQYTGDLFLASKNAIFALRKMTYFSKVDQFASSPDGTKLVET